jgi:hypothetical protein
VILLWSGGLSGLMFGLLKRFDILRLKPEVEESVRIFIISQNNTKTHQGNMLS